MKRIKHLIFLIHPLVYVKLTPEAVRKGNLAIFVEKEHVAKQRWLDALEEKDGSTLLLQLYGPKELVKEIEERPGGANVCYVHAEVPDESKGQEYYLREYYRRLTRCIRDHMVKYGLEFDPETVTSELWGESFEGCAPGYGGAFAKHLGLKLPPEMKFEMSVHDSKFLHGAKRWEVIPLPGSDIEAWMFECHDDSGAAIFQARLSEQWLDKRPIHLQLDPTKIMVWTKTGFTVWPERAPVKGDPEGTRPFVLTTSDSYWVRAQRMGLDEFRDVLRGAYL